MKLIVILSLISLFAAIGWSIGLRRQAAPPQCRCEHCHDQQMEVEKPLP